MDDNTNEATEISNGDSSPLKQVGGKTLPIPDITILKLNYWIEDPNVYDQTVLKAMRGMYEFGAEETKSEGSNPPKDILLCSGYEIEKRDILECKNIADATDPLMQKDLTQDDESDADIVSFTFSPNGVNSVFIKFNDYSRSDEKSICWTNRSLWILRKPVDIFKAKEGYYIILHQKHTSPPSLHFRFRMNLAEELLGNANDLKESDSSSSKSMCLGGISNQSRVSWIEKEIFKAACIHLEMYYTLFICCPRSVVSKSSLISSTQKVLLIDECDNPVRALNFSQYLVQNTPNQVMVLLLVTKSSQNSKKRRKKHTDSESEKRLDFDEDFKSKSLLRLESFASKNSSNMTLLSQVDDKNYIQSFEEGVKSFTGSSGFECAIDLRIKSYPSLLESMNRTKKASISDILFENMGFNSSFICSLDEEYEIDPNLVLLCSKKCVNLCFKNFTTFLCNTKYDLEITSFLTQIIRSEKENLLNKELNDKLDIEHDRMDELHEARSYYK
ncbi:unnamed protein product [Moneuplotes crassus]|uniref:Uncharacterized protein n=2 Tax=Euplotes crassus TaxID=5936 RepID=A0AAD1UKM1_EUPCR|nr:unnamed protein product [Moneuplotes crassus]